jgi:glycosyltransferase involved in cell wall biosynthesis
MRTRRYDVLHVIANAQREATGIARLVAALAAGLDAKRYGVHVWFLSEGPLASELATAGASVRVIHWSRGYRQPAGAWRFARALHGQDFAIVHQHHGGRSVRWLVRALTGAKVLAHLHGPTSEIGGRSPVAVLSPGADAVIATSRATAELVPSDDARVVYPGVRLSDMAPTSRGRHAGRVIGVATRLVALKGISDLVRALPRIRADVADVRLEIAGSGPELPRIESEVGALGLSDCVTFLGWQADLAPVFSRWDIFVQPSLEEGLGISLLEAMAAGLPVVATAVGGVPEVVEDGRTGFLVPPREPAALADRVRCLLLDAERRRVMGAAGRARVRENFSVDRMVAAIAEIYDELLPPRRPARSRQQLRGETSTRNTHDEV